MFTPRQYNSLFSSENNLTADLREQLPKNMCQIYRIKREVLEVAYRGNAAPAAAYSVKMGEFSEASCHLELAVTEPREEARAKHC